MAIVSQKDKEGQSIPIATLRLAMDTVEAAAKAWFHAPNPRVKNEMLLVIDAVLPAGYTKCTTLTGLIVERIEDDEIHRITVRAEKASESGLCPFCSGDLLKADVVSQEKTLKWIETTVYCGCRKFVRILERRRQDA
jgi:hypothetical protein